MPVMKIKQKKTKKKPVPRTVVSKTKPKPTIPRAVVNDVCGLTDPFCDHAIAAKYPDASSAKTLSWSYRAMTTINSTPTGYFNAIFYPQLTFNPVALANTGIGNSVTSWDNFTTSSAFGVIERYRIVSVGFILRPLVAPLNQSGTIHVRGLGSESGISLGTVDTTSYNTMWQKDIPYSTLGSGQPFILSHSSQPPQNFYLSADDAGNVSASTSRGYLPVTISGSGLPVNAGAITIQWIINYELVFDEISGLQQLAAPAPPVSQAVITAAAKVTSSLSGYIGNTVTDVSRTIASRAAQAIVSYVAGPSFGVGTRLLTDARIVD